MDEKIFYLLLILAYGLYSGFRKNKKDGSKRKPVTGNTPPPPFTSQRELIPRMTGRKENVPGKKTAVLKKPAENLKSKNTVKPVAQSAYSSLQIDEIQMPEISVPEEATRVTADLKAWATQPEYAEIRNEASAIEFNAREALIQSTILNRPEY